MKKAAPAHRPSFRTCNNHCAFCFIDQLPPGLRPSLYVKDEDYRLSYLFGNFVTLTNVTNAELKKASDLEMSPLYVSVHATDPEIRIRMLKHKRAGRILEQLRILLQGGMEVHVQVVLCPGWNEGDILRQTLEDLLALDPPPQSVGVVPVGLTKHREKLPPIESVTPEIAERTIKLIDEFQVRCRPSLKRGWVYGADEFYLLLNRSVPDSGAYDGFWQEENGIGMVRRFVDDLEGSWMLLQEPRDRVAVATGELFAPILDRALSPRFAQDQLKVVPIRNTLLGEKVTVAGLIAGADLLAARESLAGVDRALIPDSCLSEGSRRLFLDDLTLKKVSIDLGIELVPVLPTGQDLLKAIGDRRARGRRIG